MIKLLFSIFTQFIFYMKKDTFEILELNNYVNNKTEK